MVDISTGDEEPLDWIDDSDDAWPEATPELESGPALLAVVTVGKILNVV